MKTARPLNLPEAAPARWDDAIEAEAGQRLGAFDAALIRRLLADDAVSLDLVERALQAYARANSIGALAAKRGWLSMKQIFDVLSEQAASRESFGEIAQRLGMLTREQVTALADEQSNQAPLLTIAELLVRMGLHVSGEPTPFATLAASSPPSLPSNEPPVAR